MTTYEVDGPAAVITINRPQRYNAFRGKTVEELITAFRAALADTRVAAVIVTGAGEKAFCTGGDVKQRAETDDYGPTALRFLMQSFNADTDHQAGLGNMAMSALEIFAHTDEGREGAAAFADKRPADFSQFGTA